MVLVDNEVANDNLGDREWDNAVFNEILGNKGVEPQDNLTSHRPENESEESDSSFISDCPSWMLEDFEGPMDDDIFANKAPDHAITIFKTLRAFIKEKKKRRAAERQLELIIRRDVDGEGWFSDAPAEEEDDIESLRGSDDERIVHPVWTDGMEKRGIGPCLGMEFISREKYREVLRDWAVRNGWDLKFIANEKKKITVVCKHGCFWRIHASHRQGSTTYQVKTLRGVHTCSYKPENAQANYKYIGKRIENMVRDNPNEGLESLKKKFKRDVGIECSLHKVFRAKKYALELVRGEVAKEYERLYDYCETIVKTNRRSTMILKVDRSLTPPVLQRVYCCLSGLRDGFLDGCRPIIGLDGCFLKGIFKGQLLTAVGRDGNDNLYPIAYAYVEIEKFDTWEWFLSMLIRDIGSHDERGWTFISDRQKGLIQAVSSVAPNAEHRFCLRHMYNNFKKSFKGEELKRLFWRASSTYNVNKHLRVMAEIQRVHPKKGHDETPYEWLSKIPSHQWARCFFPNRTKCDVVVNNISESFNSYILETRELHVIQMFEWMRRKIMTRIQVKREGMERFKGTVCPNIMKKIDTQTALSRNCHAIWGSGETYEVMHGLDNHVVVLDEHHCSCGMFQMVGYPCCHAIAAMGFHRKEVEDYVNSYLKKDVYLRVYSHSRNPIPGMHDFEESSLGKVSTPKVKIGVGRPKKKRIKDGNDIGGTSGPRKGLTHTCSICGKLGHNKAGHNKHRRQSEVPLQIEDEGVSPSPSILISYSSI
ncbi:hypothetical protein BUALT_Bualt10G0088200 [Buddleja alternifolia]|uniref:SWIM-type domain-containing protein n=1 Tax=Buddleja alternifolia TaxID=168488 RepID=A0AAV6X4E4_9LAMI|nr:hypothetical protein BUALT_Bualt10G0088200 [Buddleja alternifolia]